MHTRNTALNVLGQGIPLVVAVFAIPPLTRGLGPERFGVLALAWAFIGYFTVFDMGLARSLTQTVAERLGRGRRDEVPDLFWTALLLLVGFGVVGAAVLGLAARPLVTRILEVPVPLHPEGVATLQVLGMALPIVIVSVGLKGMLEAAYRFDLVNVVRAPLGAFTFLGPLAVLPFTRRLDVIVAVLAAGRAAACLVQAFLVARTFPGLGTPRVPARAPAGELLRQGGWITVSNVVSPFLVYADRFVIGSVLSMSAVAYYATPHEVLGKALTLPQAVAAAVFPAFAATFRADPTRTAAAFEGGVKATVLVLFPLLLVCFLFAEPGLRWWVGPDFAAQGAGVVRWLALGFLLNGLAQIPFALVQGTGRPDLAARFHVLEVAPYLLLLWWALQRFGLAGAAMAWTARAGVDAALLFAASWHLVPATRRGTLLGLGWTVAAVLTLGVARALQGVVGPTALTVVLLLVFAPAAWRTLLHPAHRAALRRLLRLGAGVGCVVGLAYRP